MKKIVLIFCIAFFCASCKYRPQSAQLANASQDPFASGEAYQEFCAAHGVALPNQPLSNKTFWQTKRIASVDYPHFGGLGKDGVLYMHEEGHRGCILGFTENTASSICWSANGDVCFWEDPGISEKIEDGDNTYFITRSDNTHPGKKFIGPHCTSCHAGDNPFVSHDGRGDPAYDNFPDVKFNRALVPGDWPKVSVAKTEIQCAGSCHTLPEPTLDYCVMATGMIAKGLMIGAEIGLQELVHGPLRDKNLPSGSFVDDETCQKYKEFLEACDALQISDDFSYDFDRKLENLGRCL